jgi:hypothetical protein
LILAVEPDSRQASRLSVVLRGRRNTDVVMSKSAEAAIEAMGGRVPDVVLTSQLLSPQDEQRLADWLKDLGPSATHVQALTIPILATRANPEPERGLLAGLLRRTQNAGSQGCEPKIFAEHVATYLDKGETERMEDAVPEKPAVIAQEPALMAAAPAFEPEAPVAIETQSGVLPAADIELNVEPPTVMMTTAIAAPEAVVDEGAWLVGRNVDLSGAIEAAARESDTARMLPLTPVYELPTEVVPMESLEVVFPEVVTVRDGWGASRYVDCHECDTAVIPRAASPDPAEPVTPMAVVKASAAAPVMDEWGLFDPSKCGFSALLDKLDEITEEDRRAQANTETSVRVVTHY